MRRPLLRFVVLLLWLLVAAAPRGVFAQMVVVANNRSGLVSLDREDVVNLFLGRYRHLPSGVAAQPIDLPADTEDRANFYRQLVHREPAQINSYWARLTFSGRTPRPVEAKGVEDLINRVAANAGAIGYIRRSQVDGRVKVVLELAP